MRNEKGQLIEGSRYLSESEKIKKSESLKKQWVNRPNYHGQYNSPTHNSWRSMKMRCNGSNKKGKKYYKDRGISYCDRWNDFKLFLEDMGERPIGKTLDRIDNSKGYYKENCRWSDHFVQANNRPCALRLQYLGEKYTLTDLSIKLNITRDTLRNWYYRGVLDRKLQEVTITYKSI